MSLRNRVADVFDQAPLGRRLWFAPPLKLSLAAVGAVAVLALAVLFVGSQMVGPTPSQTPEPSVSAPANSGEPTASTQPTPTLEPTAVPTPGVAAWTGLDWSADVVGTSDGANIYNILPWNGQYVGAGSVSPVIGKFESGDPMRALHAAFFTSPDGTHWTKTYQGSDDVGDNEGAIPYHLVPAGSGLLAVGSGAGPAMPLLWRSDDGLTWTVVDSPTWRDIWLPANRLISIAAGPAGLVAAGEVISDCCTWGPAVIAYSADGLTWDRLDLSSAFNRAYLSDVTAYPGGFALVGRVGEADVLGGSAGVGKPAAWTSPDGMTWLAAEVEGSEAPGASLFTVVAGVDGLFATGYTTEFATWQSPRSGWASTDGRSWQLLGETGTDLPPAIDLPLATGFPTNVVSDGAHMIMFGRESTELAAWTSLDGVTWTQLAGTEGWSAASLGIAYAVVMPNGVFAVSGTTAPALPTYWFLNAITK
jgi:hypothetical protein